MVFDDDLSILEVIKIVLDENNYNVSTVSNFNAFKEEIKKGLPDLILLDAWMGDKDGSEIMEFLKKKKLINKIKIVMISALSDVNQIAKSCGADDFLRKPFEINDLLKVVEKNLNSLTGLEKSDQEFGN